MKGLRGFDVPFDVCLGRCFHHSHRQENTFTHEKEGERERVAEHHRLYSLLCCLERDFRRLPLK